MPDAVNTRPAAQPLHTTPTLPVGGLLPTDYLQVEQNLQKQKKLYVQNGVQYRTECLRLGKAYPGPPCAQALHITLCFDGTNNHEPSDSEGSPPTTSNIARLYHASIGQRKGKNTDKETDQSKDEYEDDQKLGYYRYYMQGVGTEFKEIKEAEPQQSGLVKATGGEKRINWGLTRLLAAVQHHCDKSKLSDDDAYTLVEAMGSSVAQDALTMGLQDSYARRKQVMQAPQLALQKQLEAHRANRTAPDLLGLQLYVYGFSRGAAAARAFTTWLEDLTKVEVDGQTRYLFAGVPISIVFLGLFDTVATVGWAYLLPVAEGHMGWADDSMRLPDSELFLEQCVHLVSAHEQRGCFPVDSIRRKANPDDPNCPSTYRNGTYEYLYPGVHSDVGGGYPPGEQGKALAGMDHVLSQVALHHMYDAAFKAGAPLQVRPAVLRPGVDKSSPWLVMQADTLEEFNISPQLIDRFNNWQAQLIPGSLLEDAMAREAELITAWRIYTFITDKANLPNLPFYTALGAAGPNPTKDMSDVEVAAFERLHKLDMARDVALRENKPVPVENEFLRNRRANDEVIKANYTHRTGLPVTINTRKTFEPMLDKRQIDRGMDEFVRDYNGAWGLSPVEEIWSTNIVNGLFGGLLYLTNEQDEAEEYARMRAGGKRRHDALINQYGGLIDGKAIHLFLFFDDQIHDSRAWFMNSAVNEREVFTDYFRYRAVFFDDESSKRLSLVATAGQILGVAIAVASIGLTIKRHDPRYLIGLLVPSLGIPVLRGKVSMPSIGAYDTLTGFALPMLEGLNSLRGFTQETGKVGAVAKLLPLAPMINEFNATTPELKAVLVANDAALAQEEKLKAHIKGAKALDIARADWFEMAGEVFGAA